MDAVFDLTLFSSAFLTLFVIMDPPGTVPVFLALTSAMTAKQRSRAALQAVCVAFAVIIVFVVFGAQIFGFLNISAEALRVSGGLLLLLVAMELLTGKMDTPEPTGNNINVALVPLGTPLLAGPGAIVAAMVAVERSDGGVADWASIIVAIILVHVCLYVAMRFANVFYRILGEGGVTLVTRLAGLLLAAIAVQLMADGILGFVQHFIEHGGT